MGVPAAVRSARTSKAPPKSPAGMSSSSASCATAIPSTTCIKVRRGAHNISCSVIVFLSYRPVYNSQSPKHDAPLKE